MNILAVFVSAAAAFIIGFLAHGPVSGKLWMKLANIHSTGNEKLKDMIPQMLWNFLANLVTAFVMTAIFSFIGIHNAAQGAIFAIWLWLGFLVTSSSIEVIWMNRSSKLWLFECASSLVVMISMGIIIAVM